MNRLIARVSDPEQRKALPAQKQKLYDYAKKQGWKENADFIYEEFDETAYKSDVRKLFREKVVEPLLNTTETEIVVFDKIDRFTRDSSSEEKAILTKLFRQGKIELHFPSDNLFIHKDSPAADLFRLDIGVALAGYYSSAIRDNVKRRFDQKVRDGEWPGKAPIGYTNVVIGRDAKGDDIKDIIPDPERDHYIVKGFELRSSGMSYEAIAKQLKKEGLRSNTKLLKPITRGQWEEMLNNPFYYGVMRYKGELYQHRYKPIIDRWLWERCQEVKESRSKSHSVYNKKPFLFRDLRCNHCGYTISFDGPKKGHIYGKCTEYGGKHGAVWIREEDLAAQIKPVFDSIQVPEEELPTIIESIERDHDGEQEHYKRKIKLLTERRDAIDEEIKEMFRDRKKYNLRPQLFEEIVKEKEKEQEDILEQMKDHGKADKVFVITAAYILDIASRASVLFDAPSSKVEQKRYLINFVLSNLKLDGQNLLFNLKEPFDALAKFSKTQNWLP